MSSQRRAAHPLLTLFSVLVSAWLILPTLVVIPMSFSGRRSLAFPPDSWSLQWYRNFFTDEVWMSSLLNSVRIALLVMVVATVLGTLASFALVRTEFKGKVVVSALIMAPLIVPGVVVAIAVFTVFLSWRMTGTMQGFVLAHSALALPYVIISVSAELRGFDRSLEMASMGLGAGPLATFRQVTLPAILPAVLSGALFAFIASFDEVVVALFVQSPTLRTLPVQMYSSVTTDIDPTIAAASTMTLLLTTVVLTVVGITRKDKV